VSDDKLPAKRFRRDTHRTAYTPMVLHNTDPPPCTAARHGLLQLRITTMHYEKLREHLQVRPGTPWRTRLEIFEHMSAIAKHLADAYVVAGLIAKKCQPIGADEDRKGWDGHAGALLNLLDDDTPEAL